MKDAGLVSDHKEGTRRLYRVHPGGLAELRSYFDSLWGEALERLAAEARKKRA